MSGSLFVISGGPGSGKTTVLNELERLGYSCVPEVARGIIQDQVRSGGTALPWADREAYAQLMLQQSTESYWKYRETPEVTFFDRGIPDTLCYARLIGLSDTSQIEEACRFYRYASRVFLAPPWEEIYATDNERRQDFAEAVRTFDIMANVYRECGYDIVELPRDTPSARAQFIIARIPLSEP
jgi:predicted ATPase